MQRQPAHLRLAINFRQPKVRQLDSVAAALDDEDIPRLDVAMHEAALVGEVQRQQELAQVPCGPRDRKRAGLRVDLPKTRAAPRQMALHGIDREVEESGDLDQLLVEHVLQDEDAALHGGKLGKTRHRGLDRFLTHQRLHGVRAGRVGNM